MDGGWRKDENFTNCSALCGGGIRTKFNYCDTPKPQHGGKNCPCNNTDTTEVKCDGIITTILQRCNEDPCPGKIISNLFTQQFNFEITNI